MKQTTNFRSSVLVSPYLRAAGRYKFFPEAFGSKKLTPKRILFLQLMEHYSEHWDEWTHGDSCFLNEREIIVINNYIATGYHTLSRKTLVLSPSRISAIFHRAKLKLMQGAIQFEIWLMYRKINCLNTNYPLESFLNKPVDILKMNASLRIKIVELGFRTIGFLLIHTSEQQLGNYRGGFFCLCRKPGHCFYKRVCDTEMEKQRAVQNPVCALKFYRTTATVPFNCFELPL